jgi:hypothetical protein
MTLQVVAIRPEGGIVDGSDDRCEGEVTEDVGVEATDVDDDPAVRVVLVTPCEVARPGPLVVRRGNDSDVI